MKRGIITPTYVGHFKYIEKYPKSFDMYLIDRKFPICFVIEQSEDAAFRKIIKPYKDKLNINIFYLEDIFAKYGIDESPEEILKKYGRLSFQTIKKFYGGLYSEAEEFFFLDSESMLIKPTNMNEVFDDYFRHPKFFLSRVDDRHEGYKNTFVYNYICTIAKILNISPDFFAVESYEWFYKREILQDLIDELGQPIDIIKQVIPTGKFPDLEGVLEALLYYLYIYKHNNKYKYDICIVQNELKKYLGLENYKIFRNDFDNSLLNVTGLYESCMYFVNKNNVQGFINLFNDKNIQVMRFKEPNNNYIYQKEIIERTNIKILPSEQDIMFGINYNRFLILCYKHNTIKYLNKLNKHLASISLKKSYEIFSIIYYLVITIFKTLLSKERKQ